MIEAIIKRFQDAGFVVRAHHSRILDIGILTVWKRVGQEEIMMEWSIPQSELNMPADYLFHMADMRIDKLNQAIAEKW